MGEEERNGVEELDRLWAEHRAVRFPRRLLGKNIEGINLVLLDDGIAGCVTTFLTRGRQLDARRMASLGLCYGEAVVVGHALDGDERVYFERLAAIARFVLEEIRRTTPLV